MYKHPSVDRSREHLYQQQPAPVPHAIVTSDKRLMSQKRYPPSKPSAGTLPCKAHPIRSRQSLERLLTALSPGGPPTCQPRRCESVQTLVRNVATHVLSSKDTRREEASVVQIVVIIICWRGKRRSSGARSRRLSLIHISEPRDRTRSRMPSSA